MVNFRIQVHGGITAHMRDQFNAAFSSIKYGWFKSVAAQSGKILFGLNADPCPEVTFL